MGKILQFARCHTFMPCPKTAEPAHRVLSTTVGAYFMYVRKQLLLRRKMRRPHLTTAVCHDVQRQKLTVVFIYVPTPFIIPSA